MRFFCTLYIVSKYCVTPICAKKTHILTLFRHGFSEAEFSVVRNSRMVGCQTMNSHSIPYSSDAAEST